MMEHKFKHLLILTLILSLTFTPISQIFVAGWEGEVEKFVVCESLDDSEDTPQPVNVKTVFLTSDPEIFAYLLLKDVSKDPIRIEWVDPDGDINAISKFNQTDELWRISYIVPLNFFYKIGKWTVIAYANNETISSTSFELMSPEPLLTVTNITQDPAGAAPFYVGNTHSMTYTLKNVGGDIAKDVRFDVEELTPSEGLSIPSITEAKDLAAGSTDEWTIELLGEKPGNYLLRLGVYLGENRLTTWNWTISVVLPDLVLLFAKIEPKEAENIHPGEEITITYAYKNDGNAEAKQVGINIELPEELELISVTPNKDIKAGEEESYVIKLKAMTEGKFEANVTLNSFGFKIDGGKITIGVSPNLFYTLIPVISGIVVLVFAIVAVILFMRRHKKRKLKTIKKRTGRKR